MRRTLAVALVALGVAAAVALLASSERSRGSSAPRERQDQPATTSTAIEASEPRSPDRSPIPSDALETEAALPDERKMDIEGRVVVVDEDLLEHPSEDGGIAITLWEGDTGKPTGRIAIVGGKFHARVTEATSLDVDWLSLAGRQAWVDTKRTPIPDDHVLEIRARWPRPTTLRVIDGETRADLSDLTVVEAKGDPDLRHPGDYEKDDILVQGGCSPLSVHPSSEPIASWSEVLYVSAPGYAWSRAAVGLRRRRRTSRRAASRGRARADARELPGLATEGRGHRGARESVDGGVRRDSRERLCRRKAGPTDHARVAARLGQAGGALVVALSRRAGCTCARCSTWRIDWRSSRSS
jgi:hypothetical protein